MLTLLRDFQDRRSLARAERERRRARLAAMPDQDLRGEVHYFALGFSRAHSLEARAVARRFLREARRESDRRGI